MYSPLIHHLFLLFFLFSSPRYCSCDADCDAEATQQRLGPWSNGTYGFEDLIFEQGVDFFVNGHEHNYERNWPTYVKEKKGVTSY